MTETEVDARVAQLAVLPDPSGLLRAIMLNPDEDDPRLRYSDWLEEQESAPVRCTRCAGSGCSYSGCGYETYDCPKCDGRGEVGDETSRLRAEYIRRWIQSHRTPDPLRDDGWLANIKRVNDLYPLIFHRYGLKTKVAEAGMDRGFIWNVETSWYWWAANGDKLRAQEWVPRVKITAPFWLDEESDENWQLDIDEFLVAGRRVRIPADRIGHGQKPVLEARYPGTVFELPGTEGNE